MMQPLDAQTMLTNGQLAPLSSRPSPRQHASQRSYLTGAPASYSPLHGPDTGLTLLTTSVEKITLTGHLLEGNLRSPVRYLYRALAANPGAATGAGPRKSLAWASSR